MKKNIKKLFIVFFVTLISFYSLIQIVYYTREPIYVVTDSLYYETTIKLQKTKLKYNALKNNLKIVYIEDKFSDGKWRSYNYNTDSAIIFSPYISMLYSFDDTVTFSNPIITIDKSCEGELFNASGDYISGFEKLAKEMKDKYKSVYLLSSKSWPLSNTKASAFEKVYGQEGLTKINLKGDELEQKAFEIVEKINKEKNPQVVSTGTELISYFSKFENNINYSLESYQALSVPIESLNYIIYEDLSPLLDNNSKNIVLETKIKNNQEGLINFFLHLYRSLQSLFF